MKTFIYFAAITFLIGHGSIRAATITGTLPITAPVAPSDTADTYPSHLALYGKGGWRTVADVASRDAIPAARREEGMIVVVLSPKSAFRLEANLTSWVEIPWQAKTDTDSVTASISLLNEGQAASTAITDLARKLGATAIPLTLDSSTPFLAAAFARESEAFHPDTGLVVGTNVVRSVPATFGWSSARALLIERNGTNIPFTLIAQPNLYPARMTSTTNIAIAGPWGIPASAVEWRDDTATNSHFAYYENGTNTLGTPFSFSMMVKPAVATNLLYTFRLTCPTNFAMYRDYQANLGLATPTITQVGSSGDYLTHDAAIEPMANGWYRFWVTATAATSAGVRFVICPANFLNYVGTPGVPQFYTQAYSFNNSAPTNEFALYPMSLTNGVAFRSKDVDSYRFTNSSPFKSAGSLVLWVRTGARQSETATLFESLPSGGLRVEMGRGNLTVTGKGQSGSVTATGAAPQLAPYSSRIVTVTWNTNGLTAWVDGAIAGTSTAPTGGFVFDPAGQIGAAAALTNAWNGHIAAAYVPTVLTASEVLRLNSVVGVANP